MDIPAYVTAERECCEVLKCAEFLLANIENCFSPDPVMNVSADSCKPVQYSVIMLEGN